MPRKTKAALAMGACPDCGASWMSTALGSDRPRCGCGYMFNCYQWPWITADLPASEGS